MARIKNDSILVFCPESCGGTAEHVHYQATALADMGVNVVVACPRDYRSGAAGEARYELAPIFPEESIRLSISKHSLLGRWRRLLALAWHLVSSQWRLAVLVARGQFRYVLLGGFGEYLSPFWVWPHLWFSKFAGVSYVANLHDPVRDFKVGPLWWHRISVRLAFSYLRGCLVHSSVTDPDAVPGHVELLEAPVGVYEVSAIPIDAAVLRSEWGLPDDSVVFLSFGFIRDGKNLDLLIRSLCDNPRARLIVAGRAQSSSVGRPVSFYRALAGELGVSDRVIINEGFVPEEALACYLGVCDVIALTYSAAFHSQSGVLNLAARVGKPVLASSGDGPLKDCVCRFSLGVFVPPDNLSATSEGMAVLVDRVLSARHGTGSSNVATRPDWVGYKQYASWGSNAQKAMHLLGLRNQAGLTL